MLQKTYIYMYICVFLGYYTVEYVLISCSVYTPFNEDEASSGGLTFLFALLNALIVVAIVIVMTVVLVILFKYRCYRVSSIFVVFKTCELHVLYCV